MNNSHINPSELIAFTQRLVQTPSLSGQEEAVARLVVAEMQRLGYDDVTIDAKGNVVGRVTGTMRGPTLMFNAHMDHVPPGMMREPYAAKIMDGKPFGYDGEVIYGRATMDMKGPLAATVHAAGAVAQAGKHFNGEVIVTAVVKEEEARGEGIRYLLDNGLRADFAVSAEATTLQTYLGHRGKLEFLCTAHGRTSHASTPARSAATKSIIW
jgi:acetylornithine deacetylase/succinyl-diaminopimelate desuccinylase-like protein